MRTLATSSNHLTRIAIAVFVVAFGAIAISSRDSGREAAVDIGTAVQTHDATRSAAAVGAERVHYDDLDLELVASYVVDEGRLVSRREVPAAHRSAWAEVHDVLPALAVTKISQLNVVTDGVNGTLAMVHRSGSEGDRWILSLDVAEPDEVLSSTLVHEYAHMLTMGRDDLDTGAATCSGIELHIGCARPGSVLASWAESFWGGLDEPAAPDLDTFVTDYAASGVHEDLAETFLAYVTGELGRDTPTIAAKLAFFDTHPELANAAAAVRANRAGS